MPRNHLSRDNGAIRKNPLFCRMILRNLQKAKKNPSNSFEFEGFMVEVTGFEPATFWSRTKRATKLRYTSKHKANEGT